MTTLEERVAPMPRLVPFRLALASAFACLFLFSATTALAKGPLVGLRVVGANGKVCIFTDKATQLVADVNGWFA